MENLYNLSLEQPINQIKLKILNIYYHIMVIKGNVDLALKNAKTYRNLSI